MLANLGVSISSTRSGYHNEYNVVIDDHQQGSGDDAVPLDPRSAVRAMLRKNDHFFQLLVQWLDQRLANRQSRHLRIDVGLRGGSGVQKQKNQESE